MDLRFTYLKTEPESSAAYENVMRVLEQHVENPDKGSEFETAVKRLPPMPPRKKIEMLMQHNFDAFLGLKDDQLISYLAVQFHAQERPTGVFRVYTAPEYRKNGVAVKTVTKFVDDCFSDKADRIRISRGNDDAVVSILKALKRSYAGPHVLDVQPDTGLIQKLSE